MFQPGNDGPLLYVTNATLEDTCAAPAPATPPPVDASGRSCRSPLSSLAPGEVLVTWYTPRLLRPVPTHGEEIGYGEEETHLVVEEPGTCEDINGDLTLTAWMPQRGSPGLSNVVVIGCAREPAPGFEAEFKELLASIRY
jgi:hypothetical protein